MEAGPCTVRGPRRPPAEWVAAALDGIDDAFVLRDDGPVPTGDLWRDVLDAAIGDHPGPVALVLPTWWSDRRVATVTRAMHRCRPDATVHRRSALLSAGTDATVLEVADDFVLTGPDSAQPLVLDRHTLDLTAHLGAVGEVLIDLPDAVSPLPADVLGELRALGIQVNHAARQRLSRALPKPDRQPSKPSRSVRRYTAIAATAAAALAVGWLAHGVAPPAPDDVLVVEGRVGVRVPAHWTTQRITAGPGSARVRVAAPSGSAAVHFTQSRLAAPESLSGLAVRLRGAVAAETPGVFVDFDPAGRVGTRAAVTYREVRPGSQTRWAVVVDGTTSIAVGCQSSPADADAFAEICTRAVESAHEIT
ncbi:type VII secretion-associated protein [Mycolicibacterium duvalii]|uniref:Type VII secretion-associated protein n=1 Tax=Mycolicibacterium duvalii TaxID=39688 RepID=A0A7I7K309_9MYCO|nr:type VII secretion-associated protein [Mycolicibacterium duvalii]